LPIQNASFEEWEQIDNYEKPIDWGTNKWMENIQCISSHLNLVLDKIKQADV